MDLGVLSFGAKGWGDELAYGLLLTLQVAVLGFALGLSSGTALALLQRHYPGVLGNALAGFTSLIRSLPELLIIFFVYYVLSLFLAGLLSGAGIMDGFTFSPFAAGILSIGLVLSAYVSEVVKGALTAVSRGDIEAATSLGFSRMQVTSRFLLPSALRFAFPGLINLWMAALNISPLLAAIQLEDFIRAAGTAGQNTKHYFMFYGVVILVYLTLSGLSLLLQGRMEKMLYRHTVQAA
jgi:His/Glu/Gln/Arg/opine family amino acid ABC transporter permease subunit